MTQDARREMGLLLMFILLLAGSMGCATIAALNKVNKPGYSSRTLALSDEIFAMGRPQASLAQQLGQQNLVAFIGRKHTYMLFRGGAELEQIARSQLDPKRILIDAQDSSNLNLKDEQIWGELRLTYKAQPQEQAYLNSVGFTPWNERRDTYYRYISIEGLLYPAISLPAGHGTFQEKYPIHLYRSQEHPPKTNYAAIPLVPLAVVTDILLTPVYIGGLILFSISSK